jgi:hypothetical protein
MAARSPRREPQPATLTQFLYSVPAGLRRPDEHAQVCLIFVERCKEI